MDCPRDILIKMVLHIGEDAAFNTIVAFDLKKIMGCMWCVCAMNVTNKEGNRKGLGW